jgi:WD40 repeat protein
VFGIKGAGKRLFDLHAAKMLSDYVTAVVWSPDGKTLAAASGAGEIVLWRQGNLTQLEKGEGQSIDCIAFSQDGQFFAAGGQDGRVKIWHLQLPESQLIATLENAPAWVDRLAWNPTRNELAFSMGRYLQVWDADAQEVVVTLNFEASSVLDMAWRPNGEHLAVAGNQGVKVWNAQDWDEDPEILALVAASLAIAWSGDNNYIASANLDQTLTVWQWNHPSPWLMRGFPGKIRYLAWSNITASTGAPLLASSSADSVVVWEKHADETIGWSGRMLDAHVGIVQAIAFQPGSFLLASAAEDGWVGLWKKAKQLGQTLTGAPQGFSCLAWHPQGHQLAAGGQNGELVIWSKSSQGQGFG